MLVLIVVAAVTSLSVFVEQYQKQLQAAQALQQQRQLESLKVLRLGLTVGPGAGNTTLASLNLTLASLYASPSAVTEIIINDRPLMQYSAWEVNLSSGQLVQVTVAAGGRLTVAPEQQVNIVVAMPASFYSALPLVLHTTDFVKVEVLTAFQNDFARVFEPPSAVAFISTVSVLNGTQYVPRLLLDGSSSVQPVSGFIVSWNWAISPDNVTLSGVRQLANVTQIHSSHKIVLTVMNEFGLIGIDSVFYEY
jgi:hypothetical protein